MLTFAICPHDVETEEGLKFWENFSQELEEKLNEKIKFIKFKDYFEERLSLSKEDIDLYYANPITAFRLYQRGYIPVVKLKNHNDDFILIGYDPTKEKDTITVTTIYLETHILPILYLNEFDFLRTKIEYVPTQEDIYYSVKEGKADFGVMYEDNYYAIKDKDKVPIIKKCQQIFLIFSW